MAHILRDTLILKSVTIRLLTLLVLLMFTASCSGTNSYGANLFEAVDPNKQLEDLSSAEEVSIRGRLSFIRSEGLTFDTAGEIGAISIKLPLPPGALSTLWQNDQRFIVMLLNVYLKTFLCLYNI